LKGIIKVVETAFLWWYVADSTIPLCNNWVYMGKLFEGNAPKEFSHDER